MEWKGKKADEALDMYLSKVRSEKVQIRLHEAQRVTWWRNITAGIRIGKREIIIKWGYSVAVAAVVALGIFVMADSQQKVYGRVNGVPLTDKDEAIRQSQQMFEDLASAMAPAENLLGNLFSL